MVRRRGRLQRDGYGAARPQSGGPLQLLLQEVQPQDGAAAGRPDGETSETNVETLEDHKALLSLDSC